MRVRIRPLVAFLLSGAALGFAGEPTPAPVSFGTAHPGLVEALDPAGRWIVVCQARADTDHDGKIETFVGHHGDPYGDDLVPYLVIGSGEGTAIDKLLGVDPLSHHVVGAPKDRVTLFDTRTGAATDLTPEPAQEGESTHVEEWASFDDAGRLCLTARIRGTGKAAVARLVVRDLESGVETSLDPGPGLLVRAALSGDGASIDATVVTQDTDGNGELEAPALRGSFYRGGCGGPARSYSVFGRSGDVPIHRVLAVDGSLRRDAPGFVRFVGRRWIRRLEDGSLVLEAPSGEPTTIAAAAMKAKVLAIDDASGVVLFASSVDPVASPVLAAGSSGVREIGVRLEIDAKYREGFRRRTARVASIGPRSGPPAFDWSKGVAVPVRGRVLGCEGANVLLLRDSSLFVLDVDAGTETALPGTLDHDVYRDAWRAGPFAAAGGFVVDLVNAKVVGTYPYLLEIPYPTTFAAVWGLREDGALLRSAAPSASEESLPPGPFRWVLPGSPDDRVTPFLGTWKDEGIPGRFVAFEAQRARVLEDGALTHFHAVYGEGRISLWRWTRNREWTVSRKDDVLTVEAAGTTSRFRRTTEESPGLDVRPALLGGTSDVAAGRVAEIREALRRRRDEDQAVRTDPARAKDADRVDGENTAYLRELVAEIGWIDAKRFGAEAADAAFLIVQHSGDLALMVAALPEIEREVRGKVLDAQNFALLHDRLALDLGRKQRYGTQLATDFWGRLFVLPIEDRENVETMRRGLGLSPLSSYVEHMEADLGKKAQFLEWK